MRPSALQRAWLPDVEVIVACNCGDDVPVHPFGPQARALKVYNDAYAYRSLSFIGCREARLQSIG